MSKRFIEHPKSEYWSDRNKDSPDSISYHLKEKREFKCGDCFHYFKTRVDNVVNPNNPRWCPYCKNKKLCEDEDCSMCFENSFASHPKSKYWADKTTTPRMVFKGSNKKYNFDCCGHIFSRSILEVTSKKDSNWCPYCCVPPKKLCGSEDCGQCFDKSFASHPKSKFFCEDNDKTPIQLFKGTHAKYKFNCDKCQHIFSSSISDITKKEKPTWCPYCAHQKLCDREDCKTCFENSFASHPKSKDWILKKNNRISPRSVFRYARKKYWFLCKVCNHEVNPALYAIGNNGSDGFCGYCGLERLCPKADCDWCFQKSFASHKRSKNWSERNQVSPRDVFKNCRKKFEFKCDKCSNYFTAMLGNVSKAIPRWCPYCINKTEEKLFDFLKEPYPDIVRQYKPEWGRSSLTRKHLPFDFFLPSRNIIIEVDGSQHFRQVLNWEDTRIIQSRDLYKMKMAYDKKISIIRIPHKYIFLDDYFKEYSEKLQKAILKSREIPEVIYLCENPEVKYQHFHSFDFEKDGIPPILSIGDI